MTLNQPVEADSELADDVESTVDGTSEACR